MQVKAWPVAPARGLSSYAIGEPRSVDRSLWPLACRTEVKISRDDGCENQTSRQWLQVPASRNSVPTVASSPPPSTFTSGSSPDRRSITSSAAAAIATWLGVDNGLCVGHRLAGALSPSFCPLPELVPAPGRSPGKFRMLAIESFEASSVPSVYRCQAGGAGISQSGGLVPEYHGLLLATRVAGPNGLAGHQRLTERNRRG